MSEPTVSAGEGPLIKTDVQFARPTQAASDRPPAKTSDSITRSSNGPGVEGPKPVRQHSP